MYTQETYTPRVREVSQGTHVIWYVVAIVEVMLAVRLVLLLLGVNLDAGIASLIDLITYPLVAAPFMIILSPMEIMSSSASEWATLMAMIVYLLVGSGIVWLLDLSLLASTYEDPGHPVEE